jgi:hypothetical protein
VVDRSTEAPVALSTPTAPFFWGGPGAPPSRGICSIGAAAASRSHACPPISVSCVPSTGSSATMCKHRWPVTRPPETEQPRPQAGTPNRFAKICCMAVSG